MNIDRPVAEIFVEEGYVTRAELAEILAEREDTTEPLGTTLVRLGKITDKQRLKCEALHMGIPYVDLSQVELDPEVARWIPYPLATRLLVVPLEHTGNSATVAMVHPLDLGAIDELAEATGLEIDPVLAGEDDVREAIVRLYGVDDGLDDALESAVRRLGTANALLQQGDAEDHPAGIVDLSIDVETSPVTKLANAVLAKAISMRASDIHIEPQQRQVRVRFRIDGLMQEVMTVPKDLQQPLISRMKISAGLDIAERRAPQDGRFTLISGQKQFDLRVSTYPSVFGETVGIRLLDKQTTAIDLKKLGMSQTLLGKIMPLLEEPQGLIVVTGPTGSGKTTTLYGVLKHVNAVHRNIVTIEDPVEYQLPGITQGHVNPRAGVTFATGLRSILRQDPDVILVGEVRDGEAAGILVEAALTGHMVMTSLHAGDSASAITRLIDMGIEPFLLSACVSACIAQRLVRIVCPKCVAEYEPEPSALAKLGLDRAARYVRGRGCEHCARTGYRGRTGIFELLEVNSEIRKTILEGRDAAEVKRLAISTGMIPLRSDAKEKVMEGVTTVEEVIRVTSDR
jgi:type IV pilus assembly protein PilB